MPMMVRYVLDIQQPYEKGRKTYDIIESEVDLDDEKSLPPLLWRAIRDADDPMELLGAWHQWEFIGISVYWAILPL